MHYHISIFFLFAVCSFSQQLYIQNPTPHSYWIKSVWAIDSTTVLTLSEQGIIAKTTNSGQTWSLTRFDNAYKEIAGAGKLRAWMPTGKDSAYCTSDQGRTWTMRVIWPGCRVSSICFVNENVGFALGTANFGPGYPLRTMLCRTRNSGMSWDTLVMDTTRMQRFSKIFSVDSLHGWAAGNNFLVSRTIDGGKHWIENYAGNPDEINGRDINDIRFSDASNGIAITSNKLYVTTDGGNTWTKAYAAGNVSPDYMATITYNSNNLIIIAGIASNIPPTAFTVKSTNGGKSWSQQTFSNQDGYYGFFGAASSNGVTWVAGGMGMVARTIDGSKYVPVSHGFISNFHDMSFTDSIHGWVVGDGGVILNTKNGHQWNLQNCGDPGNLHSVSFVDKFHGWVAGDAGHVHSTSDGGATWQNQTFGNWDVNDIFFVDSVNGWALTDDQNEVYGTMDGGKTWSKFGTPQSYPDILKLFFVDRFTGWAAADTAIFKTTDGGHTWAKQLVQEHSPYMHNINDIYFVDKNTGWIATRDSLVLKTTDGGTTWASIRIPGSVIEGYTNVFFTNVNRGYILGNYAVYSTTDGGSQWKRIFTSHVDRFTCLAASGDSSVWIAGGSGIIMGTYKPDFLPVKPRQLKKCSDKTSDIESVSLHRNSVILKTNIETSIQIKIYSINGQLIYTGPEVHINSGKHIFAGGFSLPAGTYVALIRYNHGLFRTLAGISN